MKTVNNVINWFAKEESMQNFKSLSDNKILNIANDINELFTETKIETQIQLNKLVVVGTQSSGKSSVMNSIMGMDILPTGRNMVTRSPLNIRLHKIAGKLTEGYVEFSYYGDEGRIIEAKIPITTPTPKPDEVQKIRNFIKNKTIELAGDLMNITTIPIILDIYSSFVPNLSLTDLPGLTMVACTDKGQPVDIKERIEDMVSSYIKQEKTIILAVMQSRPDLETDLGLALIKKYDPDGKRTIGILTKPDLMNYENHVGDYLLNNISKNLSLNYGYYVVRNRSCKQMLDMDVFDGFKMEHEYFTNHMEYGKMVYKNRVGMKNLIRDLNKILVTSIKETLPSVMTEIIALENKINKKLEFMGDDLPQTKEGKISVLNKYVSNFNSKFIDSIESRGTMFNTGKNIKDIFIEYRNEIKEIRPFINDPSYDDKYFANIISSFEGNHMSFHIPPVQVLEACTMDDKMRPIMKLKPLSLKCVDDICNSLIELICGITKEDEFSQYPPLSSYILSIIVDNIISKLKIKAKKNINNILASEEAYIWTDNKEFTEALSKSSNFDEFNIDSIKNMLDCYYTSVKDVITHNIPKIIMKDIVREIEMTLLSFLIQNIVNEDKITLLKENENIEKQRNYYHKLRNKINTVKKSFSCNLN